MKDLSVLTPPLLVCAAVLIAIVTFLRHEMGRGNRSREDQADPSSDFPDRSVIPDEDMDMEPDAADRSTTPGDATQR